MLGAYAKGTNIKLIRPFLLELLQQKVEDGSTLEEVYDLMVQVARKAEAVVDPSFMQTGASDDGDYVETI
jgi:hypothetical protein